MKKFIKIGSILTLILMISFYSCKKKKDKPVKEQKEQMYAVKTEVPTINADGTKRIEKGIILGTKKELDKILDSSNGSKDGVYLMMLGPNNHVYGPRPVDPIVGDVETICQNDITQRAAQMWSTWQKEANETCTIVVNTLNCGKPADYLSPNPRTFKVYPSPSKCGYKIKYKLVKFPLAIPNGDGDDGDFNYDSKEVLEFIQNL